MSKNVEILKGYLGKAETAKGVCNKRIEDLFKISQNMEKVLKRWVEGLRDTEYPFYEAYKRNIKQGKMIEQYFDGVTQKRVDQQFIVKHGRELGDGFVGIGVKKQNYSNYYIFALYDGEKGVIFQKTYEGYPSKDDLLMDSVFELDNRKVDKDEMLLTVRGMVEGYKGQSLKSKEYYQKELNSITMKNEILKIRQEFKKVPREQKRGYLEKSIRGLIPEVERVILSPFGFYIPAEECMIKVILPVAGAEGTYKYRVIEEAYKK